MPQQPQVKFDPMTGKPIGQAPEAPKAPEMSKAPEAPKAPEMPKAA